MQKFILEVIPIIKLWELKSKTTIDICDQKLKKKLGKLKIEQQLNKTEEQKVKENSDDDKNTKAFGFQSSALENKKREVKLGIKGDEEGESEESVREEEKEKEVKGNGDFKRAVEENQAELSEESRSKSWSSSTQKIKQTDFQDNARATRRTAPIVNYQESQNKKYQMNSSKKHDFPPI